MSEEKLKPCPFCGGEASIKTITYSENCEVVKLNGRSRYFGINCIKCGAENTGIIGYRFKSKAIKAWNKRATP